MVMKPLVESPCCIAHTFQAVAALHPQRIAVLHALLSPEVGVYDASDVSYTFAELQAAVGSLAQRLQRAGATRNVGIWMAQSVEYLVSVLAVLKVGGVFIPLDPSWPVGRLQNVLQTAQPAILLACRHTFWSPQSSIQAKIGVLEAIADFCQLWWLPEGFVKTTEKKNSYSEDDHRGCASKQGRPSFSYILYTSGSSGTPKGVCGTEQGLMNRLSWMESVYPHVNADVGCFKTSVGFVDHLTEALGPLLAGVSLVIPSPEILKGNLLALLNYIETYKITRLTAVPSIFGALLPALQSDRRHAADSLRILSLSGESLSLKLLEDLHSIFDHTTILNLYGSTEVSGDSSCLDCTSLWDPSSSRMQVLKHNRLKSTPIGDPISGCSHFIVVDGGKLAGVNEEGELWVGGVGVALSYLNDHDSTMQKFIDFSSMDEDADSNLFLRQLKELMDHGAKFRNSEIRVFRTGDIAKQLPDGTVVLLGRMDRQVKIRGNRIALEEIEANCEMHPKVSRCVVIVHTRLDGETNLVAYVVRKRVEENVMLMNDSSKAEEDLSHELKLWLERRLPPVMIPQIYIPLEALPLNDSGKVDTSALIRSLDGVADLISNPLAEQGSSGIDHIQQVFARVLNVEKFSNTDDFFSRGGTSISAAHAAHILDIDMRLLYMYPSATLLYNAIQGRSKIILGDPVSTQSQGRGYQRPAFSNTEIVSRMTDVGHPKPKSVDGHQCPGIQCTFCESQEQSLLSRKRKLDETGLVSIRAIKGERWTWNSSNLTGVSLGFSRCNRAVMLRSLAEEWPSTVKRNVLVHSEVAEEARSIQLCWKVSLQACVDASPLVVLHRGDFRLFIGSHSHNFLSLDATSTGFVPGLHLVSVSIFSTRYNCFQEFCNSGELQWEATLGGRVESSAAVTQDISQVVVGCYDGFIYFFDFWNGQRLWSFKTAGEVKCQPALDPWTGLIWCGSHDHHIYALDSVSHTCVWRHDCGGSIFGSPAFNESNKTVYIGTTRGTIIAIQIQPTMHVVWSYECGAPIFGSLAVDSFGEHVICTSVSGGVTALKSDGIPAWQAKTNGPIFAGATISSALVSQVLVNSGDSHVYCLNLQDGHIIWKHHVGGPITSSAYVEENPVVLQDSNNGHHVAESNKMLECMLHGCRLLCVASTSGRVHILCAPTTVTSRGFLQNKSHHNDPQSPTPSSSDDESILPKIQVVNHMKLPGEVFSSPVMISGRIFIGCRDNFLYCLELV